MITLGRAKRIVNWLLESAGHVIAPTSTVASFNPLVASLVKEKLAPKTVIDIGVADGTPWLYEAFPNAKYHLVDPTRESLPHMQRWAGRLDAEIHNIGLGDTPGKFEIAIRPLIGGSSLFAEVGEAEFTATYKVQIERFDQIFGSLQRPVLCKIDVQGAELMVLRGMGERLFEIDVLIVETSLIATLQGDAPEFAAIQSIMSDKRYVLQDIVGMTRRPLDGALAQIDAVFVPESSPLRRDRRWSARSR